MKTRVNKSLVPRDSKIFFEQPDRENGEGIISEIIQENSLHVKYESQISRSDQHNGLEAFRSEISEF